MENVVDALYTAGSMLIFIVALSVAISSFSMVRAGIDNVVGYTETVDMAQYNNEDYVNYMKKTEQTTRIVGGDTVISSIYRALKENYVIYLDKQDISGINFAEWNVIKYKVNDRDKEYIKITIDPEQKTVNNIKDNTKMGNLYKKIASKSYTESLGEYQEKTEATSENKITYRIITYDLYKP